jgi:hypothetical protein
MNTDQIPTIGSGKMADAPMANFLRKEKTIVEPSVMSEMVIKIPPLFYWETVEAGKSVLMTAAFQWHGQNFGESYEIPDDNFTRIQMLRKKLIKKVQQTMDVLIHHGDAVLDSFGNIDARKIWDQEAIRFKFDPKWDKKVAAFNKLVRVAPITRTKAIKLGLLPKPKV